MEDTDGGLHPAVDGQSLDGDDEDEVAVVVVVPTAAAIILTTVLWLLFV